MIIPSFLITSPSSVMISLKPGIFLFLISKATFRFSQITFPRQKSYKKKSSPSIFESKSIISKAEVPLLPTFYLIESFVLGFFTLLRMIKVLMTFISLSFSEICFEDFSSLVNKYLLILDARILNATTYFCCFGLIFCSIKPLNPSIKQSLFIISLSF